MEIFDLVNKEDKVIGQATREEVHGNPALLHRVVHVLVFNREGSLYLQKRAMDKDVQPGKWDTSVGGHVNQGEDYFEAALREMKEELGINGASLEFMYRYTHSNSYESEMVSTFKCIWDGNIQIQESEIDEGQFWTEEDINNKLGDGIFTPNFIDEWQMMHTCFDKECS